MTQVALLGVKGGPAIRPGSPMPTSHLLQMAGKRVVIDCGLGVSQGVINQGVGLHDIDLIYITHLHSDHYLELGPLLHTAWTAGLKHQIQVIGPAGLDLYFEGFFASMKAEIDLRIKNEGRPNLRELVSISVLQAGAVPGPDGVAVSAIRNAHPPLIDSFALRFEIPETTIVFSGDTAIFDPVFEFAEGADLLVHEAMLMAGVDALVARVGNGDDRLKRHLLRAHAPAAEVAHRAQAAGVKRLALNHLVPSDDPNFSEADWQAEVAGLFDGPLYIGQDGLRIDL